MIVVKWDFQPTYDHKMHVKCLLFPNRFQNLTIIQKSEIIID